MRLTLFGGFALRGPDGTGIALNSRKSMALLAYLAVSPGASRSREEIMALLWSDRSDVQARGSLRQVLSSLRKELGTTALVIDNARVALNTDAIAIEEATDGEFLSGFQLKDPAFEDWLRDERANQDNKRDGQAEPSAPSISETPSIAVLPFANLSTDPEQAFFADGITQDITTELSRFYGFYVIAHRTSLQYNQKTMSAYEIGKELEVDYILDGSVRRTGDRVRITVELVEVEEETHLWADRFDRDAGDMLAIQEEVAKEISKIVPGQIEAERVERVLHRPRPGMTAYEFVLLGEYEREKDYSSPEARYHFDKALTLDPLNARAYANLAVWTAYQVYCPDASFDDLHQEVSTLAEKALEIEPNDPVNLAILSNAYLMIGEYDQSRRHVEKAIRKNANHYSVMGFASRALAWLGDTDRAQELLDLFTLHDPHSGRASAELYFEVYTLAERFDEAIAATSRMGDNLPDMASEIAAACALSERPDDAAYWRARFEARGPSGQPFAERKAAVLRACAREEQRALWRAGYLKAGFPA